jgi:hypothetical protein
MTSSEKSPTGEHMTKNERLAIDKTIAVLREIADWTHYPKWQRALNHAVDVLLAREIRKTPDPHSEALLRKIRKNHGDETLIAALEEAHRQGPY